MICPVCDEDLTAEIGNDDLKYQDIDFTCKNGHEFSTRIKKHDLS